MAFAVQWAPPAPRGAPLQCFNRAGDLAMGSRGSDLRAAALRGASSPQGQHNTPASRLLAGQPRVSPNGVSVLQEQRAARGPPGGIAGSQNLFTRTQAPRIAARVPTARGGGAPEEKEGLSGPSISAALCFRAPASLRARVRPGGGAVGGQSGITNLEHHLDPPQRNTRAQIGAGPKMFLAMMRCWKTSCVHGFRVESFPPFLEIDGNWGGPPPLSEQAPRATPPPPAAMVRLKKEMKGGSKVRLCRGGRCANATKEEEEAWRGLGLLSAPAPALRARQLWLAGASRDRSRASDRSRVSHAGGAQRRRVGVGHTRPPNERLGLSLCPAARLAPQAWPGRSWRSARAATALPPKALRRGRPWCQTARAGPARRRASRPAAVTLSALGTSPHTVPKRPGGAPCEPRARGSA